MHLHLLLVASMVDLYGGSQVERHPRMFPLKEGAVNRFLSSLNKTDPREIQDAIQMVCHHLNLSAAASPKICHPLLYGQSLTRSYRQGASLAFTDVKVSQTAVLVLVPLFSLELLLSLVGNSLVVWSFTCRRRMRSVTNFFIASLAASDLLMTLSSIPVNMAQILTGFWQFGSTVCKLGPFTTQLSVAASSLTLCCIAFDRYVAVVHPLRLSTIQSPRRAALLMSGVWLVSLGAASPFMHYQRLVKLCQRAAQRCALYCGMPPSMHWLHWVTYIVLLLVPMLLMGVSYTVIIFKLWLRQPVGQPVGNVQCLRMQYKKKAIKMLFLVMLIFLSCWMPLLTFDLLAKLLRLPLSQGLVTLRYFLQCLALSATCLNPIVYAILHDKFRKNFSQLCTLCPPLFSSTVPSARNRVTPLVPLLPRPEPRGGVATTSEAESSVIQVPEKIFQVDVPHQTWVRDFGVHVST